MASTEELVTSRDDKELERQSLLLDALATTADDRATATNATTESNPTTLDNTKTKKDDIDGMPKTTTPSAAPTPSPVPSTGASVQQGISIDMLTERQTIYKAAIAKAKQENKMDVAKYYQDAVREIDYLIREAEIGFPIAFERVPKVYSVMETAAKPNTGVSNPTGNNKDQAATTTTAAPSTTAAPTTMETIENNEEEEDDGFVLVSDDPSKIVEKDRIEAYKKLVKQLERQAQKCKNYEEQFIQNGDMAMAAKFKIHGDTCAKDLELLHIRWKNGDKFPLVKYETIAFTIAPSNIELSSNELSLEIVKGINLPVLASSYTYVIATFAHQAVRSSTMPQALCNWLRTASNRDDLFCLPQDTTQTGKVTPKQSSNPTYHHKLKFSLDRNNRSALRVLRRRPIKLEVFKKEPFWKCDSKIGTVSIKLGDLANKCTLHECHSIMNGRKTTDSKVEVIVRIRNALVSQEPISVHERLLVFT